MQSLRRFREREREREERERERESSMESVMMNVMSSDVFPMCLSILAGVGMAYAVTRIPKQSGPPVRRFFLAFLSKSSHTSYRFQYSSILFPSYVHIT